MVNIKAPITKLDRNCPLCDAPAYDDIEKYSRDGWRVVRCSKCRFVFLDQAPVYEALSVDLAWTEQAKKEKERRKRKEPRLAWLDQKTRWRLHLFRSDEWNHISRFVRRGYILDVGCGDSNRIPQHFTPFGIEIEKRAALLAHDMMAEQGGFVIHAPALEGLAKFEDVFLDGMIMRSFLEHEAAPKKVLSLAFRKLKPGGAIYVKVPNFGTVNRKIRGGEWCGFRFPDHLNYFDVSSMKAMAQSVGFQFNLMNNLSRYTNDNMHCVLKKPNQ